MTPSLPGQVGVRDLQTYPFVMIPKAFFDLKPSQKGFLVYLALRFYASNKRQACEFVPIRTMAQRVQLSESSFKRGVEELEALGAVRVRRRSRRSPQGQKIPLPNLYELAHLDGNIAI